MDQPCLPELGAAAPSSPALAAVATLLPTEDPEENPCAHVLCVAEMPVSYLCFPIDNWLLLENKLELL